MATDRDSTLDGDQITDRTIKQLELDLTNTPTDEQILKVNMPTGDFTAIDNKPSDLNISGQVAEDFLIFDGTNWVAKGGNEKITVGFFSRDISLASGTQIVTGVGFKPSAIIFLAGIANQQSASIGIVDDGLGANDNASLLFGHDGTADNISSSGTISIKFFVTAGDNYRGSVTALNSDGFTITWTKTGSPTGSLGIQFLAFR